MPAYLTTILLVVSLLVLLVVMLVLLLSYHDMVKKFRYSQKENTFLKNHLHERSVEILDGARKRAIGLLEEAEKKASEIVASAQTYGKDSSKTLETHIGELEQKELQAFQTATSTRVSDYASTLDQTQKEEINKLHEMTKMFEDTVKAELQSVDKSLAQEVASSQLMAKQELEKSETAAEKEITAYKVERLKKLDERILELLNTVAIDVFGKALPLDEHQRIVIDALEAAKKDLLKN
jgi:vacuolar-type H+-ATPase subunit I/STV1